MKKSLPTTKLISIPQLAVLLATLLFLSGCSGGAEPATIDSATAEPASSGQAMQDGEESTSLDESVDRDSSLDSGERIESAGEQSSETTASDDVAAEANQAAPSSSDSPSPETRQNPLSNTTNVLILGSDRRPETPNWRTDVMMIVALDSENGRAGVISLPRDLFIEDIPGHDPNRINVVDYLGELDEPDGGGPALLSSIIEERIGMPIHHYLRFNFDSFREVVDALGGVAVDIDCEFRGYVEEEGGWLVLEPGVNRLSGNEAMIYVRDRQLTGGDLNRARRQQRFVWAVRNQVLSENLLPKLPALYSALSDSIDTDIGLVTTLRLARLALDLDPDDLYGMVVGPPELAEMGWALGMSVFLPNWEAIAENVQMIFESPPFAIGNTPEHCRPESSE